MSESVLAAAQSISPEEMQIAYEVAQSMSTQDIQYALMSLAAKLLLLVAGVVVMHLVLAWMDRRSGGVFKAWMNSCKKNLETDNIDQRKHQTAVAGLAVYYCVRFAVTGVWFALVLSS